MSRLETDLSGRGVSVAHVTRNGQEERHSAGMVAMARGPLGSTPPLPCSAADKHPRRLADGLDQVSRNTMRHNMSVAMALMREPNDAGFQKTLAVSGRHFGADDRDYPLDLIQMCAKSHADQLRDEAPRAVGESHRP